MPDVVVQASFNSGEWSPALHARVDLQKYRSGAALLENFFVDYRGGASTRPGTKYVIQAYKSATQVRIISFQASTYVGYVVEIGNGYMRFIYNGAPILETSFNITGATQANPCVLNIPGHNFIVGDWIFLGSVGGMTQLNSRYFSVIGVSGNNVTIADLNGVALDSTGYSAYTSGGTAARIYTIPSPYTSADDLRQIKFAQSINQMVLCHPNHPAYVLTLASPNNWTLVPMVVGATVNPPTGVTVASSLGAGAWNFSYAVTSIDASGQESSPSTPGALNSITSLRITPGTNSITWTAASGAVAYNVYEAQPSAFGVVPSGLAYGFIGTTRSTTFVDSNIAPDFTATPPTAQSPFSGSGVASVAVTAAGTYTVVPTVTFTGACSIAAVGIVQLQVQGTPTIGGTFAGGYAVNNLITFTNGLVVRVIAVSLGIPTAWVVVNPGAVTSGSVPANPLPQVSVSGGGGTGVTATATWGVGAVIITTAGAGYSAAPTVSFSSGAATATATLSSANGNPTVPGFVQQRLTLAGLVNFPATFYMSQPGQYYNFNTSSPIKATDAVQGTLVSGALNSIKSIVGTAAGMVILTDKAAWVVNGGSPGSAITPISAVANPQSWIGANDVPPIVANYDILYVSSKGSAIRDLTFNFYLSTFTGTDISVISSHLFYGYTIDEWCWAEQPFYIAQAVRNDGVLLSLTFLKEQEFVAWSHFHTDGLFKSVTSVTEVVSGLNFSVDAVYTVVQRTINGNTVQYIERFAERSNLTTVSDAWCVDSGLQYNGPPATTFTGAEHLAGKTVTGLADGVVIPSFVMPTNGIFTLPAASKVTVGLPFRCRLRTLPIDMGEPSVQGKTKKIVGVDIRVKDTLGLYVGSSFSTLVVMQDLVVGNVSGALTGQPSQIVTDLVTGDAITNLDPTYTVPGQYCFEQARPLPATILGVFPTVVEQSRK